MTAGPEAEPATEDPGRQQVRGSSLLLAGQVFSALVSLATQVLIVRELTKADYGAFAYALSIVVIAEGLAGFGLRRAVSRFLPVYEERGDMGRAAGTLGLALAMVTTLGIAVVLAVVALRGVITGEFPAESDAEVILIVLIVLAPVMALTRLLDTIYATFGMPRPIFVRRSIVTPLLRLAVVALLVRSDGDGVDIAIGYVATSALGLVFFGGMLVSVLKEWALWPELRRGRVDVPFRTVLSFSMPLLTSDVREAFLAASGAVLLGFLASAADVADFRAVQPIALLMEHVVSLFSLLFFPLAARLRERGDIAEINHVYWRTAVWITLLAYPMLIVMTGLAEPVTLLLFGERYEAAAPLLAILTVGVFLSTTVGPNEDLLMVFSHTRFLVWTNVIAIVLTLGVAIILIELFGAVGAAVAISACHVLLRAVWQVGLLRWTGITRPERPYRRMYGRLAGVTAAYAGALLLGPPMGIRIALALGACIGAVVLVRGEIRFGDTFPELQRIPLIRILARTSSR